MLRFDGPSNSRKFNYSRRFSAFSFFKHALILNMLLIALQKHTSLCPTSVRFLFNESFPSVCTTLSLNFCMKFGKESIKNSVNKFHILPFYGPRLIHVNCKRLIIILKCSWFDSFTKNYLTTSYPEKTL